jgi:GDSL-like lipase/acylhydrolase family protein
VPIPPARVESARSDLYQAWPPYGYRLWPSRTTTYQYPRENPRSLIVRSNRHGFREGRELDAVDARPAAVVLGDSMVFGEGVEEDERFTNQLEALKPEWRVDNLGMTGFGPDLMLRALEQVGLALKPNAVIVTMYTDDFRRVRPQYAGAGFETPRFALESGRLADVPYPRSSAWTRLALVGAARELEWRASGREWDLNAGILDRFRAHALRERWKLFLVFLPGTADTPNDVERRAWLRSYAERTAVPFLDLTDPILRASSSEPLFIHNNWHLNPRGHLVVARELHRFLSPLLDARVR